MGMRDTAGRDVINEITGVASYSAGVMRISAGTETASGTITFANSNGVSFGLNAGTLTASAAGGAGSVTFSAGTASAGLGSVVFSNSNGVSFGLNGSTITASAAAGAGGVGLSAGTQSVSTGTVKLVDSNGISFGMSGSSEITASYTVPTVPTAYVSSINGSSGAISLATGSSLSSSQNGSTITFGLASNITTALQSAGAYLTTAAQSNQVVNSLNGSTGQISLNVGSSLSASSNGSSITFGLASNITTALQSANANYLTSQSGQAVSGSNASSTFQTVTFGASNGLSFYLTNGSMVGSYTVPTQTTQPAVNALGVSNTGTTAGNTGTYSGVAFAVAASGNITASQSTTNATGPHTIWLSVPNSAAQTNQTIGIYGSSQTTGQSSSSTYDARSLSIRGAGIVSVGNSGGEFIISATGGAGGGVAVSLSGNSTSGGAGYSNITSGTAIFAGGNNITLSQDGSRITISGANVGGAQTGISGMANSQTTYTSGTVILSEQANITIGSSVNGASQYLRLSVGNYITTGMASDEPHLRAIVYSNATQTSGTLVLTGSNGITISSGAGSAIIAFDGHHLDGLLPSGNGYGTGFSSMTSGTVGLNAVGALQMSQNGNNLSLSVPAQSAQQGSVYASSNTTGTSSGTYDARTLSIAGAGIVSVAASNSGFVVSATVAAQTQQPMYWSASGTSTSSNTLQFGNTQGVSFSLSNGSLVATVKTDYQSSNANYLTSQSNQAVSGSNGSFTFQTLTFQNSNGLSFYTTTVAGPNNVVVGSYTVPTVPTAYVSSVNGSSGAISLAVGSSLSSSTNGSTITFGLASNITTALRAANDAVGLNTALTAGPLAWTVNSSGLSLNASSVAGTSSGFAGANISGSITHNTAGINLSLSVAAPGAGGGAAVGMSTDGQTSGNTGTFTSGSYVFAGSNSLTLHQSTGGGGVHTLWLKPAMSQITAGANITVSSNGSTISIIGANPAAASMSFSGGTTSSTLPILKFSNSNNVSFGLETGSVLTASASFAQSTQPAVNALGVSNIGSTAGSTGTFSGVSWVFAGSNNISLTQSTTNATGPHTIWFNQTGGGEGSVGIGISSNTAGGQTAGSSGLISSSSAQYLFVPGSNITLSQSSNGGSATLTIIGRTDTPLSYFGVLMNEPLAGTTGITTLGKSTNIVQPFWNPEPVSMSYVRIPVSVSQVATSIGTTANMSATLGQTDTYFVNFYSQGVGANSRSLQYITGSSLVMTMNLRYSVGAASNNQTFSYGFSGESEANAFNYATNNNPNSAAATISTAILSNSIVGYKWLDIPCAISLGTGAFWIALARSSATASTSGGGGNFTNITNATSQAQLVGISQINNPFLPIGVNTTASTGVGMKGMGQWTTNTNGATTSSMALSLISSMANQPIFKVQFIREA